MLNGTPFKEYQYDDHNRLETTVEHIGCCTDNRTHLVYEQRSTDGATYPNAQVMTIVQEDVFAKETHRDVYGRVNEKLLHVISNGNNLFSDSIGYLSVATGSEKRLTNMVETLTRRVRGVVSDTLSYTYDKNGNITSVKSGSELLVSYKYDGMNQLVRENNAALDRTYVFAYDKAGNIIHKSEYPYTTGFFTTPIATKAYTYSSTGWKDQLTSVGGETITYDELGNPIRYRGHNLGWGKIRQLESYDSHTFAYDASGIRIRKDGIYYEIDGSRILSQMGPSGVICYYYDTEGVCGFSFNGNQYFYQKNLQGDITAVYDHNGNLKAEYVYDAWGNHTIEVNIDGIATLNPIRYRGYYYDTETGLYYLNSRYYDPTTGRFINADDVDVLSLDQNNILQYNLYTYCLNNPVNRFDVNGNWSMPNWLKVTVGAVATVAAVAITVATGGAALPVLIGVAGSTIGGAAVSAINHRVTTGSWEGAGKAALDGAADGFMTGGLCALGGSIIGGVARTIKNAKSGITIGKTGQFEKVAELAKTRHYSGLKEFNLIKKVAGQKVAETVGWWQNKCVVKGVMALKGAIYDCGGALTGAYAKEVALTKGYQYLYNIWLM